MSIVIVDIDGTLTKVGDRVKCLEQDPPDWDQFYARCGEDEPVPEVIDLVLILFMSSYDIVLCTGRRESCRGETIKWLTKNHISENVWSALLMRPNGDTRHDVLLKPELLLKSNIKLSDVTFVLEDRNSMVKKWRELGLMCLQVADGDF